MAAPIIVPVTGLLARNQLAGNVWLRKNEPMFGRVACFVVPKKSHKHTLKAEETCSTVRKNPNEETLTVF